MKARGQGMRLTSERRPACLTEEIVTDWKQKNKNGEGESPQIRGEKQRERRERMLISIYLFGFEEEQPSYRTRTQKLLSGPVYSNVIKLNIKSQ